MTRLIVVVEEQTEEAFVRGVLGPHLNLLGVYTSATIVGKVIAQRRGHHHRGGGRFKDWRADLMLILGRDRSPNLRVTTLFDLYGLPDDFPGLEQHGAEADTCRRCDALQAALAEDLGDWRFIPYVQRHEFEALVLAALPSLAGLLDADDDLAGLETLKREVDGVPPEDVNDGPETAPSKRLQRHVPGYRKTLHGPEVTAGAGLQTLRRACPRFDAWVARREGLGAGQ